jgi:hypothetical protein
MERKLPKWAARSDNPLITKTKELKSPAWIKYQTHGESPGGRPAESKEGVSRMSLTITPQKSFFQASNPDFLRKPELIFETHWLGSQLANPDESTAVSNINRNLGGRIGRIGIASHGLKAGARGRLRPGA